MKNYKLTIQYDGSRYKGWQMLKDQEMTIQGKITKVLDEFEGEFVNVIGSGRTDAGVHAKEQIANVHLKRETNAAEVKAYLNRYLPDDISVIKVEEVDDRFHARFNAKNKTYRYSIWVGDAPDVFHRKYMYTYTDAPLNLQKMRRAAKDLIGEHDFYSFCGNSHIKKSTVRVIYDIDIMRDENVITIDFTGNGFLQNMVRILTGTLIEVGAGKRDAASMPDVLAAMSRPEAGFMAPAQGLCLYHLEYPTEVE